jgi:hypothetical protein
MGGGLDSRDWLYPANNYRTQLSSDMRDPCGKESTGLVCRWFIYRKLLAAQVVVGVIPREWPYLADNSGEQV